MKELIVFFNGWGMDKNVVNLSHDGYDFITFDTYNTEKNYNIDCKNYSIVYVVAWSMGVLFSEYLNILNCNNIKRIAINGTTKIIDNKYGINKKIFDNTLNNLNENTIIDFYKNMFVDGNIDNFNKPRRSFQSQLDELLFIKNFYEKITNPENINNFNNYNPNNCNTDNYNLNNNINNFKKFDIALIGKYDKIVPCVKQQNFFENYKILDCGHYIFDLFKTWTDIINYANK